MGDPTRSVLSSAEEEAIGEAFMRALRAEVSLIEDPEVAGYTQSLGQRLASVSGDSPGRFTFFVVDSPGINAFAAPGGLIGLNAGLIRATESESELAAVLAHEIAHVTQRHLARSLELQSRATMPMLAGIVAAILIGTQSPQAGAATAAAVQGGATQAMLNFSRANEQEADRVGMHILAQAGFDPRAMVTFFERLQEATRYYGRPPEFLSTHPVTSSRIAEARDRADRLPYKQYPSSAAYYLVRAKLEVLAAETPQDAVEQFREAIDSGQYVSLAGATYGYALALFRAGQLDEAREVVELLIEEDPERISYYELSARIETEAGNLEEAIFIYQDNLELYPEDQILVRGYVETLLRAGRPQGALDALDRYGRRQRLDADMHRLAARAYERLGDPRRAHAALAEHYYLNGQLGAAAQQLELAKRAPGAGDFYADSRIEARLTELRAELEQREKR